MARGAPEPAPGDLTGRVDAAGDPAAREAVKRDIIALFKRVDGALTDLGQLKDDIRGLVERYKQASVSRSVPTPAPAPQFNGARPAVHADHLGASTYIEKGWSLISLGDYSGAIQALDKALPCRPARCRRSRCWAGPRCSTRTTTTRWGTSPRC